MIHGSWNIVHVFIDTGVAKNKKERKVFEDTKGVIKYEMKLNQIMIACNWRFAWLFFK